MTGWRRAGRPTRGARLLLALAAGALTAGGCGYSVRESRLPAHIRTIAVPIFVNRTSQPAVESVLTRAVVEAFSTNGHLRVVRREDADALLEGEVVGYEVQSIAFDSRTNVRQYRLLVTLNLRLRDLRRSTVLFEQGGVQERADFRVSSAVAETIGRETTALQAAAVEIGRSVVSLTTQGF